MDNYLKIGDTTIDLDEMLTLHPTCLAHVECYTTALLEAAKKDRGSISEPEWLRLQYFAKRPANLFVREVSEGGATFEECDYMCHKSFLGMIEDYLATVSLSVAHFLKGDRLSGEQYERGAAEELASLRALTLGGDFSTKAREVLSQMLAEAYLHASLNS